MPHLIDRIVHTKAFYTSCGALAGMRMMIITIVIILLLLIILINTVINPV